MPPESVYVTNHIHTEGPIPGPHSLLTVASAAHRADGTLISTFSTNVRELPGATIHPLSLKSWRGRAEDWLTTRRAPRPAAHAMTAYTRWIEQLPAQPLFVADADAHDHLFLFWYLQRFTGNWPFARICTDPAVRDSIPYEQVCTLKGCRRDLAEFA